MKKHFNDKGLDCAIRMLEMQKDINGRENQNLRDHISILQNFSNQALNGLLRVAHISISNAVLSGQNAGSIRDMERRFAAMNAWCCLISVIPECEAVREIAKMFRSSQHPFSNASVSEALITVIRKPLDARDEAIDDLIRSSVYRVGDDGEHPP